ncbi:Aste57867_13656 [Aphanomyces stellatus]|uniref:Aste57867_13656 protein n=1 Tax=Aphanomyces stellatus TaxID=120398 RepID=A0A485KZK7_9STRA|nr:hypothetical protein As57867_013606 [Aphanomyces stellatus]VFT90491.1 Aste57867_13656 [Aphanomyces stellatus]
MQNTQSNRELTAAKRLEVIQHLQSLTVKGKLPRGSIKATAAEFSISRFTVSKLWTVWNCSASLSPKKAGLVGPIRRYTAEQVTAMVLAVPQEHRSTMRDMAAATGLSRGTLSRHFKAGTLQRRSSRLKPLLTVENKLERLAFCRSHVRRYAPLGSRSAGQAGAGEAGLSQTPALEFGGMWDVVHLDEKWFNADKDTRKVYLTRGETLKRRACKSKRFIPKVMFLAAVARPRHDDARNAPFDGKIGMWPIVKSAPAARNSRNRPAGTMVTTLVNVNADVYQDYVINKVIPAIKENFPSAHRRVVLQQDNATPHRSISDASLASVSTDGWTFVVRRQPPNSPDLNVLDLGFFASIQALQYKSVSRTVDDVIQATMTAFVTLSSVKLEDVFLTLQAVMRLVLENDGDNHFRLPHLNKSAKRRSGTLMANVECPAALLQ